MTPSGSTKSLTRAVRPASAVVILALVLAGPGDNQSVAAQAQTARPVADRLGPVVTRWGFKGELSEFLPSRLRMLGFQ